MRSWWGLLAGFALPFATPACDGGVASDGATGGTTSVAGASSADGSSTGGIGGTEAKPDSDVGDAIGPDAPLDASPDGGWTCPFQRLGPYGRACSGTSPCTRAVSCQGGPQTFDYTCANGYWKFVPKPCDPNKPYDSCGDSFLWCPGASWSEYDGPEEPMGCPGSLPSAGSACYPTPGGIQTPCGYPCDPQTKTGWTIASCVNYVWILDAACE